MIEVFRSLEPVPPLQCRPRQLSTVFTNLLLNSRNAVGDKGVVRVRSRVRGEEIVVEIEDNGCGIPVEKLARIFEPSFSTEGGRVSTANWGLFNCRSIIHGLGGDIELESVEGEGTTARVTLPLSSEVHRGSPRVSRAPAGSRP